MQEAALLRCILDSLSIFGENTRASIVNRLRQEGVGFTPESFDINKFCFALEDLLGHSADLIFAKILDESVNRLNLTAEQNRQTEVAYARQSSRSMMHMLFSMAE